MFTITPLERTEGWNTMWDSIDHGADQNRRGQAMTVGKFTGSILIANLRNPTPEAIRGAAMSLAVAEPPLSPDLQQFFLGGIEQVMRDEQVAGTSRPAPDLSMIAVAGQRPEGAVSI
jgi:hypothetical protein